MKRTLINGFILGILSVGIFMQCVPEKPRTFPDRVELDFDDGTLYQIWEYTAFEVTDSLLTYLVHENPAYRWTALNAFSSYTREVPIASIAPLLADPVRDVRTLAAFVLGQSHSAAAVPVLIEAFDSQDSTGVNTSFNASILEAVGKTAGENESRMLAGIQTYLPSDSLLTLAQVRALYQMALRDIQPKGVIKLMMDRATKGLFADPVRITAANYVNRFYLGSLDSFQFSVIRAYEKSENVDLRIQLLGLLGKCSSGNARNTLEKALKEAIDYRLRVAAMEALSGYNYSAVAPVAKTALKDVHPKVSAEAARYFLENGEENEAVNYRSWAQMEDLDENTRILLYGAALNNLPFYYQLTKTALNGEVRSFYLSKKDPYTKALILENLAMDPTNAAFIMERYKEDQHPIIESTAIRMLGKILSDEQFNLILGNSSYSTRNEILDLLKTVIEKGPNGPLCEGALAASDHLDLVKKRWGSEWGFIRERYKHLEMPQQLEAAQYLEQLMQALGMEFEARDFKTKVHVPRPDILNKISDSTRIIVETEAGSMQIGLYPAHAPATVSNFLQLIHEGFYTGKSWHRIVPNFVAQTGCPDGDGFGSLDYTLPSEFNQHHYSAGGYIGMASAGPDTEGTQWFVTYTATPHLDGRYTLFGKVEKGLGSLDQMQRGARIEKVSIINLRNDE